MPSEEQGTDHPTFVAGVTGGLSLVVLAFTAIGISGEPLTRLIRNHPYLSSIAIIVGVLTVVLVVVLPKEIAKYLAILLSLVLIFIVGLAVYSLNEREYPEIALTADVSDSGKVTLTVEASASTLDNNERMLVQIVGLPDILTGYELEDACRQSWRVGDSKRDDLDVLLWNETGSDPKGEANVTVSAYAPVGEYDQYCAVALVSTSENRQLSQKVELSWAYIGAPTLTEPVVPPPT